MLLATTTLAMVALLSIFHIRQDEDAHGHWGRGALERLETREEDSPPPQKASATITGTDIPANNDADPCSSSSLNRSSLMGGEGEVGIMYSVAGSESYARTFLPVVDYLRTSLGLLDASERNKEGTKWALVTEPHLCRGVLRGTLSFFDIVVTVAVQSDDVDASLRLPDVLKFVVGGNNMKREKKKVMHTKQHILGNFKRPYAQDEGILYWSKMIKVTAMARVSPFKMTIFTDMDNIPCHADFARRLLGTYGLRGEVAGGRGMDIGTLPSFLWTNIFKNLEKPM